MPKTCSLNWPTPLTFSFELKEKASAEMLLPSGTFYEF